MPHRVTVTLLLSDPIPPETPRQRLDRLLTVEGWMDGILAWEPTNIPELLPIDYIAMNPVTEDPGDDWATRPADPNPTGGEQ